MHDQGSCMQVQNSDEPVVKLHCIWDLASVCVKLCTSLHTNMTCNQSGDKHTSAGCLHNTVCELLQQPCSCSGAKLNWHLL